MVDSSRALTARNAGGPRPFSRPGAQARTGLAGTTSAAWNRSGTARGSAWLFVSLRARSTPSVFRYGTWQATRRYPRAFPTG